MDELGQSIAQKDEDIALDHNQQQLRHVQQVQEGVPVAQKPSTWQEVMSWVLPFVCALVLALLLRTYVFELISVDGPSMQDTLVTGEVVYINKTASWLGTLRRGDVVLCHFPGKTKNYIKRLVALPGDIVQIVEGQLYINGEQVSEPYLTPERVRQENFGPMQVDPGYAMVMGDNRSNSSDSRSLGQIELKSVLGRGTNVIWPLRAARKLSGGQSAS